MGRPDSHFPKRISISPAGTEAGPSAMLDVVSTSKGVLIPRMVSTQRVGIDSPTVGLLVFDTTTESFWFYGNDGWTELSAGGRLADRDGNTRVDVEDSLACAGRPEPIRGSFSVILQKKIGRSGR